MEILFGVLLVGLIVGGAVCGIVALSRLRDLALRMSRVERELGSMRLRQNEEQMRAASGYEEERTPPIETEEAVESEPMPPPEVLMAIMTQPVAESPAAPHTSAAAERPTQPRESLRDQWSSFEVTVGSKLLNWVGIVLVTFGILFFLKFAYDNEWIGPRGRIAIGVIVGAAAMIVGERARRGRYPILFHTLTGGGLAALYGSIYFSFQVYQLTGQTFAFVLLLAVTALALAMSVAHDAPLICLFAQFGGFLSPILISTGQNRPVELFAFIAVLNLATMGSAYYKNWKNVNVAAFAGTWLLYAGWAGRFYGDSQLGVALGSSALFYLMFLIVPTLRAAARREALAAQDLWLIAIDVVVEFVNHYSLLYVNYRPWLGAAVILQALTLSVVYAYWTHRCSEDSKTRVTLLFAALILVTLAVPIQLRLYGIPIAWGMEALLLGFIGIQYRQWVFQFAAAAAIVLAAGGLVVRLPLHVQLFTLVFNRPFGSWATVIAMAFALYALFQRGREKLNDSLKETPTIVLGLAVVLLCALGHMEISDFWETRRELWPAGIAQSYQYTSLTFLWSAIPLVFLCLGRAGIAGSSIPAALAAYAVGSLVILQGASTSAWIAWNIPFVNLQWLSRFFFAVALWIGANWMDSVPDRPEKWQGWTASRRTVEAAGHLILAALLYVEVGSWISASNVFSSFMRFGFVSALWSLQALTLIGVGLGTRSQFRRIAGFILFGVTVAKLLLIDMEILQPVYRILSFAVTGLLLIVAAYLYQKFAKALLESNAGRAKEGGS